MVPIDSTLFESARAIGVVAIDGRSIIAYIDGQRDIDRAAHADRAIYSFLNVVGIALCLNRLIG